MATETNSPSKRNRAMENTPKKFGWQKFAGKTGAIRDVVAVLGKEKFADRARRYDEEASFPFENYDDMRDAGILAMTVPERNGGLGVEYKDYALLAAEMGKWCGATALTFNMHACTPLWTGHISDDLEMSADDRKQHSRNRELHFARIVENGAIFAQPFSEGSAAAAGKAPFGTMAAKVDGGWLLNGRKIFASLSGAATYYGVVCTEDKPDSSVRDTLFMAVPADAGGVSVVGPWDPVGMRATVSRTLLMENVFISDEQMLLPRGAYYQAARRWPHMFLTLCPTYMGIAQAAYDFTVAYLRGDIEGIPVKRRMYPTKQISVADMWIKLQQTWAIFKQATGEARVDPSKEDRLRAYAAQYTVMENANEICRLAIRTCGGQSMLKSLSLERMYRDSRLGSLMLPWTAELCLDRLGRETLYEAGENDDD
ncbi:MAG: acyl-CoA dehydrogenase family protein [Pseudomonadota bacterium]|nr:acyl-CoA dehydrogenase family protein [Pseudomonadota bacterium]